MHGGHLDTARIDQVHQGLVRHLIDRCHVPCAMLWLHDQRAKALPHGLVAGVAEDARGGGIEIDHATILPGDNDGIERRANRCFQP